MTPYGLAVKTSMKYNTNDPNSILIGDLCPDQKYDSAESNDIWFVNSASILKFCQLKCKQMQECNFKQTQIKMKLLNEAMGFTFLKLK